MRHAYVTLIVLATVFSMAWYKIVVQRSLSWYTMEHPTNVACIFLVYYTLVRLNYKTRVYTKKIQVTCGIFHGIPFKNTA